MINFGLSSLANWSGSARATTNLPYTAPELLIAAETPTPRATVTSDVYTLGCVGLYVRRTEFQSLSMTRRTVYRRSRAVCRYSRPDSPLSIDSNWSSTGYDRIEYYPGL